jgi:hypothetical protein
MAGNPFEDAEKPLETTHPIVAIVDRSLKTSKV